MPIRVVYALVLLCVLGTVCSAERPPLVWEQPEGFDPDVVGLGLPLLEGVEPQTIYDPADWPGLGGWYNHDPNLLVYHGHVIVVWPNHIYDENGPGQRILARCGKLDAGERRVLWNPRVVELAPSPVPMARRGEASHPDVINGIFTVGNFAIINDKLYFRGDLQAYDGWTDDVHYHGYQTSPTPKGHYRLKRDIGTGFIYDSCRDLGMRLIQEWGLVDGELVPTSPMYLVKPALDAVEVETGRFKPLAPLGAVYREARPLADAPASIQQAARASPDISFRRRPRYAPDTAHLTTDEFNGLAHMTEYRRPDGSWVVLRDNLMNPNRYYAAEKPRQDMDYPPAMRTNLFGHVKPVAGELPDGRVWIIGNDQRRLNLFLTVSDDGVHFNRTWLLYHEAMEHKTGMGKVSRPTGPQYQHAYVSGENILVAYSVSKENIGFLIVPIAAIK